MTVAVLSDGLLVFAKLGVVELVLPEPNEKELLGVLEAGVSFLATKFE